MTRRLVTAACITAVIASVAACAGGGDKAGGDDADRKTAPLTLTLAAYAQPDPDEFVAAVRRLSHGSVRIKATTLWRQETPDYERATVADVRDGRVDLAIVGARVFDLLGTRRFDAVLAPFLVDSLALEAKVLGSPLAAPMVESASAAGVVGLGVLPGALRRPIGLRHATVEAEDYRGALVGVRPSWLVERTFQALGARVRTAVFPRDLDVVDAIDYHVTGLDYSRYDRFARSIAADVVIWPHVNVVIANRERLAALDATRRALLRQALREAFAPSLARVDANETSALRAVCERGDALLVSASRAQRAELRRAVQPVYDELARDPFTRDAIARIEAMRADARPDVLRCPDAVTIRPAPPGSLDGTYEWSVTRSELLAAGDTPAGSERNAGRWRLVLRAGRYELRNLDFGDVYRGAVEVTGNRLRASVDGTAPSEPPTEYRWSLYRDRLLLAPIEGRPAATQVVVRPLIRVR